MEPAHHNPVKFDASLSKIDPGKSYYFKVSWQGHQVTLSAHEKGSVTGLLDRIFTACMNWLFPNSEKGASFNLKDVVSKLEHSKLPANAQKTLSKSIEVYNSRAPGRALALPKGAKATHRARAKTQHDAPLAMPKAGSHEKKSGILESKPVKDARTEDDDIEVVSVEGPGAGPKATSTVSGGKKASAHDTGGAISQPSAKAVSSVKKKGSLSAELDQITKRVMQESRLDPKHEKTVRALLEKTYENINKLNPEFFSGNLGEHPLFVKIAANLKQTGPGTSESGLWIQVGDSVVPFDAQSLFGGKGKGALLGGQDIPLGDALINSHVAKMAGKQGVKFLNSFAIVKNKHTGAIEALPTKKNVGANSKVNHLYIPYNTGGHWILLSVRLERDSKKVHIDIVDSQKIDPVKNKKMEDAFALDISRAAMDHLMQGGYVDADDMQWGEEVHVTRVDCAEQEGQNCGIHTLENMHRLTRQEGLSAPLDANRLRPQYFMEAIGKP